MDDWIARTAAIARPPIAAINRLAAELADAGQSQIDLGQAVLGLPPPAGALERVRRYLDEHSEHVYSPDPGLPELRQAIAHFVEEHKEVRAATADQVLVTCGANQAYVNAVLALTRPGDEVILFGPGYFDHDFAVKLAGCIPREIPLRRAQGRLWIDRDAVLDAIGPRTRAITLVTPGNPTGMVITAGEIVWLSNLCRDRKLWLLSDETYDLLTFAGTVHQSPAGLDGRVVLVGSFSKVYGLAAWRVGYLFGPADLVEETIKVQDALVVCAPVPSQHAALGALEQRETYVPAALQTLQERRDELLSILTDSPLTEPLPPEGATFVFGRLTRTTDDVQFCTDLLRQTGIITVPGSAFGPTGAGWVRFSFGNQPLDKLREAGDRLRSFT